MPFPKKFKKLLETSFNDIELPDYAWLTYAVCGCHKDSCGWGGWVIDSVFAKDGLKNSEGTKDKSLPIMDDLDCPICKKPLFRTEVNIRFVPSEDQKPVHGIPGVDYEVAPIEYE